jgi:hypothetical protein
MTTAAITTMPELALALYALYLGLAFGLRSWLQWRRTGSTGFHGVGGRPGSAEWLAGVGFVAALVMGAVAPLLALLDVLEPLAGLDGSAGHAVGLALALIGIALTLLRAAGDGLLVADRGRPR